MSWNAAGLVVVGKTADELRDVLADRFAENGPISGYADGEFGRSRFAVGNSGNALALWDPIGKLAFGPRGEDIRCALSKGTKLVAFSMSSAEGKYGLRVYEDGKSVRDVEVEGGQSVRETGTALVAERQIGETGILDEDWVFSLVRAVTGVGFEELGEAPYQIVDV